MQGKHHFKNHTIFNWSFVLANLDHESYLRIWGMIFLVPYEVLQRCSISHYSLLLLRFTLLTPITHITHSLFTLPQNSLYVTRHLVKLKEFHKYHCASPHIPIKYTWKTIKCSRKETRQDSYGNILCSYWWNQTMLYSCFWSLMKLKYCCSDIYSDIVMTVLILRKIILQIIYSISLKNNKFC